MCPSSVVRYAAWVRFGPDSPFRCPLGANDFANPDAAIDWAEAYLASQPPGKCWVGVYRYRWCPVQERNLALLVWEDDNYGEG